MTALLETTKASARNFGVALWTGFLGGNIASFVKWGTEVPFPPRTPDRAVPPAQTLTDLGFDVKTMIYQFSGRDVNWGVSSVHHLLSIAIALFYCVFAEIFPKIKLWQGAVFGVIVAFLFHGVMLPIFGWSPPLWELPFDEILSEIFGTVVFMWVIEVIRRDIRNRITGKPDPELQI